MKEYLGREAASRCFILQRAFRAFRVAKGVLFDVTFRQIRGSGGVINRRTKFKAGGIGGKWEGKKRDASPEATLGEPTRVGKRKKNVWHLLPSLPIGGLTVSASMMQNVVQLRKEGSPAERSCPPHKNKQKHAVCENSNPSSSASQAKQFVPPSLPDQSSPFPSTSWIPLGVIWNLPSASGKHGESTTLAIRSVPLPLRIERRVVEACARMLPPMGFFESAGWPGMLSTEATTWFVMTTAMPNWG